MTELPLPDDPNLLVGTNTADDAAVYRLSDELALVQTVDFFTPVVDDPYDFGRIAAANSLSDVYAMGAKPLTALNIVGFPLGTLPLDHLVQILKGGAAVAREAGLTIVGGHTIDDPEPKYGLAVTGTVQPGRQLTNSRARAGDYLVLTKPLGTGVIATAIKRGGVAPEVLAAATECMAALNKGAAEAARACGVASMTDVTGFGLLGHLLEMAEASGVTAEVWFEELPWLPGAVDLALLGVIPGGTWRNLEHVEARTEWVDGPEEWEKALAADAQTSGGLLIAVPEERLERLLEGLAAAAAPAAALIGRVYERGSLPLVVRRKASTDRR
jgi:selenide,water dikinase